MRKVYSCKDDFDPTSTTVSNAIRKILSDYSREVKVKVPTEEALSYVLFSDIKSPVNVPNYNNSAITVIFLSFCSNLGKLLNLPVKSP